MVQREALQRVHPLLLGPSGPVGDAEFVAVCCSELQTLGPRGRSAMLSRLQLVVAFCSQLQCDVVSRSLMGPSGPETAQQHTATKCNTPQQNATHCNTLQHTATHYSAVDFSQCITLQNTAGMHTDE